MADVSRFREFGVCCPLTSRDKSRRQQSGHSRTCIRLPSASPGIIQCRAVGRARDPQTSGMRFAQGAVNAQQRESVVDRAVCDSRARGERAGFPRSAARRRAGRMRQRRLPRIRPRAIVYACTDRPAEVRSVSCLHGRGQARVSTCGGPGSVVRDLPFDQEVRFHARAGQRRALHRVPRPTRLRVPLAAEGGSAGRPLPVVPWRERVLRATLCSRAGCLAGVHSLPRGSWVVATAPAGIRHALPVSFLPFRRR